MTALHFPSRYPWGQEAFDKAKKENKIIFLSGKGISFQYLSSGFFRNSQVHRSCLSFCYNLNYQIFLIFFKFILYLLVGYSTCHWCHVMERESFENETIGKMLNDNFVSIKVDREERPDVDKVYMTFVQV